MTIVGGLAAILVPWSAMMPSSGTAEPKSGKMRVYIGTYTNKTSKGIYLLTLDLANGALSAPELVAETASPSFVAVGPHKKYLYACNEVGDFGGKKSGAVSAYAIDPQTGKLTFLNREASGGDGPCHLSVDHTGRSVLVANYGGGSVGVLPVNSDGSVSPMTSFVQHHGSSVDKGRQQGPHAHFVTVDASNKHAFCADLGMDQVIIYRFDPEKHDLNSNDPHSARVAPGSGPRHMVFHPNNKFAYVINEMGSTVNAFAFDPKTGAMTQLQTISSLPTGFMGNTTTAEIAIHPSGKFLYGSNRGHDSIVAYSVDPKTGLLALVGHVSTRGKTPRSFDIDPTGNYLLAANQDSDSIVSFHIEPHTGKLKATGHTAVVSMPVCVKIIR